MATNRTPIRIETGFSQLVTGSPSALPTGTRPEAIAPTTVPMKKGVTTDEIANAASARRRCDGLSTTLWKANPEPRRTIPRAARQSGMNSVDMIDANAVEKAVQRTTRTKINQTWLASQTGPIAQSINSRGRRPRSPPPARSAQSPAPKSAPPKTA